MQLVEQEQFFKANPIAPGPAYELMSIKHIQSQVISMVQLLTTLKVWCSSSAVLFLLFFAALS